jgi:A/G-specific adenine glycosylase
MERAEAPRRGRTTGIEGPRRDLGPLEIAAFRDRVLGHYKASGRSFPWRSTRDPWAILVSEIMLQQTQTDRVLPKYLAWLEAWPDPAALAAAALSDVLELWSGLGYNRRALSLVRAASLIAAAERFPDDEESLLDLPGVGPYTARAVLAFAFGRPVVLMETNIRSVFLHSFFEGVEGVADSQISPLVEATLLREDPRTWYYALMDYGVEIKRREGNPNRRSAHYAPQSPFADSKRRIRGSLLKALVERSGEGGESVGADADELAAALPFARERVDAALTELVAEGFVAESGGIYRLGGERNE